MPICALTWQAVIVMPDCSLVVTTFSKHSWPLQRIATRVTSIVTFVNEDRPSSNHRNHRPIVGAPVAPQIAASVPAECATQTAGAVTVTAIALTRSAPKAAAKVIAANTITSATATITAAAGKCAGGKPGTSENKDNCKNNDGAAQHWRPL